VAWSNVRTRLRQAAARGVDGERTAASVVGQSSQQQQLGKARGLRRCTRRGCAAGHCRAEMALQPAAGSSPELGQTGWQLISAGLNATRG
jgi:hypothetical protein